MPVSEDVRLKLYELGCGFEGEGIVVDDNGTRWLIW